MTEKKCEEVIVQSNALIESHHRLTLQEKRIVLWLIQRIKRDDKTFNTFVIKIKEFAELIGLNEKTQYKEIKRITKGLVTAYLEINNKDDGSTFQTTWLSYSHWKPREGICKVRFTNELEPALLQLKDQFTQMDFREINKLKSCFSMRIYELLKQYKNIGNRYTKISDIRKYCGIREDEYGLYSDLKRRILDRARREITEKTDLTVDYTEIKDGRKVIAVEWTILEKVFDKAEQKQQTKETKNAQKSELDTYLIEYIKRIGYSESWAKRLHKKYDVITIKNAVEAVKEYIENVKADNPKALLKTALIEEWSPLGKNEKKTKEKYKDDNEKIISVIDIKKKIIDSDSSDSLKEKQLSLLSKIGENSYQSWIMPQKWKDGKLVFLNAFSRDRVKRDYEKLLEGLTDWDIVNVA